MEIFFVLFIWFTRNTSCYAYQQVDDVEVNGVGVCRLNRYVVSNGGDIVLEILE